MSIHLLRRGSVAASRAGEDVEPAEMIDATGQTFTDSGSLAGQYHIYGEGLPGVGAGLVVHLHGDEAYEHDNPTHNYGLGGNKGLIAVSKAKGYVFVSAKAPDTVGAVTWWESGSRNADYLAELIEHLIDEYNIDDRNIWLSGYSGGAQQITQYFMPKRAASVIRGGGAIIAAGGGTPLVTASGWTSAFKANFQMHWITGGQDDGEYSDDGYNALADAVAGRTHYDGQGFTTTRREPPGLGHELDGIFGAFLDDVLSAMPGFDAPDRTPGSTRPTLITSYVSAQSSNNTTTTSTTSFTPDPGEVIVVKCWNQDWDNPNIDSVTGGGLSFGVRQHIQAEDYAEAWIFVAEVGDESPGSMSVSVSWWDQAGHHGMIVERWANAMVEALPASNSSIRGTGAPNVSVTPTTANSVITWLNVDWNVASGSAAYRSSATQTQSSSSSNIKAWAAYQEPSSTSAQTVGMTAPTGQKWSLAAIELLPAPDPD